MHAQRDAADLFAENLGGFVDREHGELGELIDDGGEPYDPGEGSRSGSYISYVATGAGALGQNDGRRICDRRACRPRGFFDTLRSRQRTSSASHHGARKCPPPRSLAARVR